jgi:formamidopyrimidine-DNA glycosylase
MPELPEVERARRLLEERCLGRQVTSIKVVCGRYQPLNKGITPLIHDALD